jgi:esterase/lipase superfamily enzyme
MDEGAYRAAQDKYRRSLALEQQIGDLVGEAATWHQLATIDLREGAYPAARLKLERSLAIKQQIGNRADEAVTWNQLAAIDLNESAYPAAREKLKLALAIDQQIGHRAGEAAALHNLASIDIKEGAYSAAREKFELSLAIKQQIGDRAGEAASWSQLGYLAIRMGNKAAGLRLACLCFLIDREVGSSETDSDWRNVSQLARSLDYTQEQLVAALQEAIDGYTIDRGAGLLNAALGHQPSQVESAAEDAFEETDRGAGWPRETLDPQAAPPPAPAADPFDDIATLSARSAPRPTRAPQPAAAQAARADAEYLVWYGTNRRPNNPNDPQAGYSAARDDVVHHGRCRVFIPRTHKIGSIGSPWWRRLLKMTDDRLRLLALDALPADAFWQGVATHLQTLPLDDQSAVVFVHGYNVSFEAAALRAAQIGLDLSIKGAMAFFSWPSCGTLEGYLADAASIEVSEDAIADFLTGFALRSGARSVHIIAHSMGNRGVLRAINNIAAQAELRSSVKFGQIILAAADVDADLFRKLSAAYAQLAARTTLYVSQRDRAIEASRWLHEYPRAGLLPPVMVCEHCDTINVTNADLTMLGHGYVAEAREVLGDMHALLATAAPPQKRFGLQEMRSDLGRPFWQIGG